MSNISQSAGLDSLFFSREMRIWESDMTVSDWMLDAAAIRAEEIPDWEMQIKVREESHVPLKIPPIPHRPVAAHQAASTWQIAPVRGSRGGLALLRWGSRWTGVPETWASSWAFFHSFASLIAFRMISFSVNDLPSNKSLLRDFHRFQRIYGHSGI